MRWAVFSPGIERALRTAQEAHDGQVRKGGEGVPYVVHPLHVAIMLARLDADEETIQAALLHDVVEDCADWTLERVEADFGKRVRAIVADVTEDKSRSWAERKQDAVDHVPHMLPEAATLKAADKLHNLESLVADLQAAANAEEVWRHFRGGREDTLRMAQALVEALVPRVDPRLGGALRQTLAALEQVAGS